MFCISKNSRLGHKEPALQGTGATVIVWCRRTGCVAKHGPLLGVFQHPGHPVFVRATRSCRKRYTWLVTFHHHDFLKPQRQI